MAGLMVVFGLLKGFKGGTRPDLDWAGPVKQLSVRTFEGATRPETNVLDLSREAVS